MHIDLDAFFVSVERQGRPELAGKPVVVGGNPEKRGVVAAASYEARKYGIHSAMPLKTAARLCPHAIFIPGNHQKYQGVSASFMNILADFSPYIEPLGIDEAFLDVTGFESLHGSIRQMAKAIRGKVNKDLGITASIGIGGCKVVAKIASEMAKPDGVFEVKVGADSEFLAPLPISKLPGIGKKTETVLKNIGVTTLGQLAKFPPDSIKERLGSSAGVLINYARGIDNRPVETPDRAKSYSRENTFSKDTRDRFILKATLELLSQQVGAKLRKAERFARCITLKLRFNDFSTITRSQTLSLSTDADQIIFSTGTHLLTKELDRNPLPVRLIGIGVSSLCEKGGQLSMLENSTVRFENLNRAIDKIRLKYGFDSIQTGRTFRLDELFDD